MPKTGNKLTPAEVEMVLRRAAELSARRRGPGSLNASSVSPEILVQVAAAAGIAEDDVRRALHDFFHEKAAEPGTLVRRLYGPARLRTVREVEKPMEVTRTHLENLLKEEYELKLRRKTEASSLWDAGEPLGA